MTQRWLYLRIFHEQGPATDEIIVEFVGPVAHTLLADGSIDRFFFLRYFEDGHHLRLRLRLSEGGELEPLRTRLVSRALELACVSRVESADYAPELAKHGGAAGLELAERQFFESSRLALAWIEASRAEPDRRALFMASAATSLLDHAGLERREHGQFWRRYGGHWVDVLERASGAIEDAPPPQAAQVERVRARLDAPHAGLLDPAPAPAQRWLAAVAEDAPALRELADRGQLTVPWEVVLSNLIHTFANRLGLGLSGEVTLAKIAAITSALPPRSWHPPAVDSDDPRALWATICGGLDRAAFTAVAIEGDPEALLHRWRRDFEALGGHWLEGPRGEDRAEDEDRGQPPGSAGPTPQRPFPLWRRLAQGQGDGGERALDHHLAQARAPWSDPDCPMLPDPFGVHCAIGDLLLPPDPPRPTLAVLRDVALCGPDCLEALSTIVRRGVGGPCVLVIVADARTESLEDSHRTRWSRLMRNLRAQAGLHRLVLAPGPTPARCPETGPPSSPSAPASAALPSPVEAGLDCCRSGALHAGVAQLAAAIAADPSLGEDPLVLVHLAMASLQLRAPELAMEAAEAAYRASPGSARARARARRVWMAAMHRRGDSSGLDRLYTEIQAELTPDTDTDTDTDTKTGEPSPWLLLDAALATALRTDRRADHVVHLDAILARPATAIPPHCLAIAHIWRAAPAFVDGLLHAALPHQRAGAHLLESLADPTRLLITRLRLGGTLMALERFAEAAPLLDAVTTASLARGDTGGAASRARRLILAYVGAGQTEAAARWLHGGSVHVRTMWRRHPEIALYCEVMLALALGERGRARVIAEAVPQSGAASDSPTLERQLGLTTLRT